jgi:NADH-quinone oxidoreductase subunit N
MTASDLIAILPLLVVAVAAVAVMLATAWSSRSSLAAGGTILGLAVALIALLFAAGVAPRQVTPLLRIDRYGLFYLGLILAAGLAVVGLSFGYLGRRGAKQGTFHVLLLLGILGAGGLVTGTHLASFFLSLELLSVSLYALIAYTGTDGRALEAGLKYLVLAGASSAFLLFGMALIYAEAGTLEFSAIGVTAGGGRLQTIYALAGLALMLTGIGFKLAVVPFHMWTPDVYEGAPAPVAAFVASVSKGAVFAILLRYFTEANAYGNGSVRLVLILIAMASMLAGNLLALLQENVKRLLAYSSIAHLGYLLVAFLAAGPRAAEAVTAYLVAYFVAIVGAFGVIAVLSGSDRDADLLADYRGLFWRRPGIAWTFTAMLLSLAGIPLTAGFVGKFYVLSAGVGSALWLLVLVLILGSVLGLFYYLRIIVAMLTTPSAERAEDGSVAYPRLVPASGVVLALLVLLLLWFGLYPAPFLRLIEEAVVGLT